MKISNVPYNQHFPTWDEKLIICMHEFLVYFLKNKGRNFINTWTNDKLMNLIKCLQEFKSSMEFRNCDSNTHKVRLYESVRKSLAKIYEDETNPFSPASVSKKFI